MFSNFFHLIQNFVHIFQFISNFCQNLLSKLSKYFCLKFSKFFISSFIHLNDLSFWRIFVYSSSWSIYQISSFKKIFQSILLAGYFNFSPGENISIHPPYKRITFEHLGTVHKIWNQYQLIFYTALHNTMNQNQNICMYFKVVTHKSNSIICPSVSLSTT